VSRERHPSQLRLALVPLGDEKDDMHRARDSSLAGRAGPPQLR
jgi:hypothetical protein